MQKRNTRLARPYPLPPANPNEPDKWNRPLFSLLECLDVSQELLDSYWERHTVPTMGDGALQAEALTNLAVARLESLLHQGRKELSGQLSMADWSVVLTSHTGEFVAPADYNELADSVATDDRLRSLQTSKERTALVKRLRGLTNLQRTALFDAIEVIYFSEQEPSDVLQQLGIQVR